MSRIEATAEALEERSENDDWEWCLGDAQTAIAAADAYDAAHGIHRVSLDDATVERAARALAPVSDFVWERLHPLNRLRYVNQARAVLAAAVEAGQ